MKKLIFSLFIFHFSFFTCFSQNLVPNPSFEEFDTCADFIQGPYYPHYYIGLLNWITPSQGSPDLLANCSINPKFGMPQNQVGFQIARTGNCMVGLGNIFGGKCREDIQSVLIQALEINKEYCISLYVNLADSSWYATDNFGICITDTAIYGDSNELTSFIPQILNPIGRILDDKINWTKISGIYIAHGGEKYITIGTFTDDNHTDIFKQQYGFTQFGGPSYKFFEYYIDDVSVMLCSDTIGINEVLGKKNNISVFPNPASDNITVAFGNTSNNRCAFELYDVIGNRVFSKEIAANQNSVIIPLDNVAKGVYICKVTNEKGDIIYNNRIVVIK